MVGVELDQSNLQPEGISPQQQERFNQLHAEIVGRLKPYHATTVVSSIVSSDSRGRGRRYHLSLSQNGRWSIGSGRSVIKPLNDLGKPVELVEILQACAFVKEPLLFDNMINGKIGFDEYLAEKENLKKSVKDNPGPFADSFLEHMAKSLKRL